MLAKLSALYVFVFLTAGGHPSIFLRPPIFMEAFSSLLGGDNVGRLTTYDGGPLKVDSPCINHMQYQ